jgi:hypothetical protein
MRKKGKKKSERRKMKLRTEGRMKENDEIKKENKNRRKKK